MLRSELVRGAISFCGLLLLCALAIAGACVAPAAMAQTANPVTLYGRVSVNFESVESKGAAPLPRRNRVEDRVSLFGIRGTEDLGGGLAAFFSLMMVLTH